MRHLLLLLPLVCAGQVQTSSYVGSIPNAIAAAKTGTVLVNRNYSSAATIILRSNMTVTCLPGIVVTQTNPAVDVFAMLPGTTNASLKGCKTVGGNNSLAGFGLNFFTVTGNTFTGWHGGIRIGASSFNGTVSGNTIIGGAANCLDPGFFEDIGATLVFERNIVDNTGCQRSGTDGSHGLAVHTSGQNGSVVRLTIRDNWFVQGGSNYPIEVTQNNQGLNIDSCLIDGNHILMNAPSNGGISLGGSRHCSVSNNFVNMNGFTPYIAAFELVNSLNITFMGNHAWGGGANSYSLSVDTPSGIRALSNELGGYVAVANSGTFPGVTVLSDNAMIGNMIIIPEGSTILRAVLLQCNVAQCIARRNVFSLNTITGVNLPGSTAVYLEEDSGIVDGTQVMLNSVTGFTNDFGQDASVTNTVK